MGKEDGLAFRVVKKLLEVVYLFSVLGSALFLIIVIYAFTKEAEPDQKQLSPQEEEHAKNEFIAAIIILVISLICAIIGMYGVLKENKYIVITMTVLSAIGVIAHIVRGKIASAIVSLLITILTGVYTYMIIQKEKKNAQNVQNTKV